MKRIRSLALGLFMVTLLISSSVFLPALGRSPGGKGVFRLQRPSFGGAVLADDLDIGAYLDAEAGFSAYFHDPVGITLASVRGVFRTIETETADYIIGSVPVPGYTENEDAHVYVHKDGWVLAYYLRADPSSKAVDMISYLANKNLDTTKLQNVLAMVAAAAGSPIPGATYYDFRYPNATHMMMIGETMEDGDYSFTLQLPSAYGFYEHDWAVYCHIPSPRVYMEIDGASMHNFCAYCYGSIPASQLLPNVTHNILMRNPYGGPSVGVILLTYRVP